MPNFNLKIADLPTKLQVPLGKTGRATEVDVEKICSEFPLVAKAALLNGFISALGDISRGFSDEAKKVPNTDEVWAAAREKRAGAWLRGEWASKERGDSAMAVVKEQYVFEQMVAGATQSKIDKSIRDTVAQVFGDETKATFENFLNALARLQLGPKASVDAVSNLVDKIEAALRTRAIKRAEETKAATSKIVLPDLAALLGTSDDEEAEAA